VNPSEEAEMRMREASFDLRCLDKWAAEKGIMLPPATRGGRAGSASVRALAEGSPSLQVLEAIGDPLSTDGKSAVVRFGALERPLALVSAAIEPDAIYATLRSEFPWIEEGARIVAQTVALSASRSTRHYRAAPLILWGPAGCGKSRWVRRVRELLGIPGDYLALGGAASSACVMGCERSWQGGRPSFPVATMAREQCANPVLVVDELDKAGTSRINGTPVDALLPMLDPETSRHYADVYLLSPVDLSEVTWLIPLNDLGLLPDTLVSRAHVIRASRPEARHFDLLVTCMIADYAARESLQVADLPPLNADMAALRKTFEETLSPRGLRLAMEKALGASIWAPPGPRLLAVGGDNDIVAGAE
jgi:hypothetical protein